jgi:branched-chain amino acid transport system permease protein
LVAAWAWSIIGLVYVARLCKHAGAEFASGGVILLIAMLTCGVVGFSLERLAYKPLRKAPRLNVLITAIGVSLLLQNLGQLNWMFSTAPQRMPTLVPDKVLANISFGSTSVDGSGVSHPVAAVPVRLVAVLGFATSVVLMIALDWLVFRTKIGRAMRAVSYSPETASLMGIPVDRIISFTFVLGASLAAAAGFLYGQVYPGLNQPASASWTLLGLKAFVAAVVGGIGNIRGAMLGGLLIGGLEQFGKAYTEPKLADLYVFSVLILVLLFRPSGILGRSAAEKV